MTPKVLTGLESMIESPPKGPAGLKMGLLCNPASVDRGLTHAKTLLDRRFPGALQALYSPQHGFFAEKQDNMIESDHMTDPDLGIPVFSLYGETRIPTRKMLDPIDILIIDLQDVGTRVYTFIHTMSHCLEAAKRFGKKVIVCDRPNPVNGIAAEGPLLSLEYASFVGRHPIPMRHGLTMGELALLFNREMSIGCELEVIPMKGWKRRMRFCDTGLPWVPPSPNMPIPETAMVYPGQVMWEGTNVSEGRGATRPFEFFGAPFIRLEKLKIPRDRFPGILLRPAVFEPTSNKWSGETCFGFQIHVTNFSIYRPYGVSLRLMAAIAKAFRDDFQWKSPPYEYEYERMPIDLITGGPEARLAVENGWDIDELERSRQKELDDFTKRSREFWLYDV
ncbi:conserved hypothetical protein [Candidatus Desulfarcum epimagneticum]|uniref:DUF1343 domain-containing protein n=1 Tax=uncultured Desulfobacteraceae bacterium TaxID=218296 RepID=A0A484HE24_9BACT|nr:conserved hypothetical protein [uncultured Desulfobacteraceae bacterium]